MSDTSDTRRHDVYYYDDVKPDNNPAYETAFHTGLIVERMIALMRFPNCAKEASKVLVAALKTAPLSPEEEIRVCTALLKFMDDHKVVWRAVVPPPGP